LVFQSIDYEYTPLTVTSITKKFEEIRSRRLKDQTMQQPKPKYKMTTIIYKTIHRKLKI